MPFYGTICEVDPCSETLSPCQNEGLCSVSNMTAIDETVCACETTDNYFGETCEEHQCRPNPCQNEGICDTSDTLSFTCDCDPTANFTGVLCEVAPCDFGRNPCKNGGLCINNDGHPDCDCEEIIWFGQRCEEHPCDVHNSPCQNFGTCSLVDEAVVCDCTDSNGFYGDFCEIAPPVEDPYRCGDEKCLLGDTSCEIECPFPEGFYCDSYSVDGYCKCGGKDAVSLYTRCAEGMVYNPIKESCDLAENVDRAWCPDNNGETGNKFNCGSYTGVCSGDEGGCVFDCPLPEGFYCDEADPSAYCFCGGDSDLPSRYEKCPSGLVWNPEVMTCDFDSSRKKRDVFELTYYSSCGGSVPTEPTPTETPEPTPEPENDPEDPHFFVCTNPENGELNCGNAPCGYYCSVDDSASYCYCPEVTKSTAKASYNTCPSGLVWDPVRQTCNFEESVDAITCSNSFNACTQPTDCDDVECLMTCPLARGYHCDPTNPAGFCWCDGEGSLMDDAGTSSDSNSRRKRAAYDGSVWVSCPSGLFWDHGKQTCNVWNDIQEYCPGIEVPTMPPPVPTTMCTGCFSKSSKIFSRFCHILSYFRHMFVIIPDIFTKSCLTTLHSRRLPLRSRC